MEKQTSADIFDYCKRFAAVLAGSLFFQIFVWAICDLLQISAGLFLISALLTALLYHGIQQEEKTGISRLSVFFAAILIPFLCAGLMTVRDILMYPDLNLLGAEADGVSQLREVTALYSARLTINGAILLVFSLIDALFLRKHKSSEAKQKDVAA